MDRARIDTRSSPATQLLAANNVWLAADSRETRGHLDMGRKEKPIDPSVPQHRREFAQALRELRTDCNSPSYRTLATYAHCAAGLLSEAGNGKRLPTWDITKAYVT